MKKSGEEKQSDGRSRSSEGRVRSTEGHLRYDPPPDSHSPGMSQPNMLPGAEFAPPGFGHPGFVPQWLEIISLMQRGLAPPPVPPFDLIRQSFMNQLHAGAPPPAFFPPPHLLSPGALGSNPSALLHPAMFSASVGSTERAEANNSPICLVQPPFDGSPGASSRSRVSGGGGKKSYSVEDMFQSEPTDLRAPSADRRPSSAHGPGSDRCRSTESSYSASRSGDMREISPGVLYEGQRATSRERVEPCPESRHETHYEPHLSRVEPRVTEPRVIEPRVTEPRLRPDSPEDVLPIRRSLESPLTVDETFRGRPLESSLTKPPSSFARSFIPDFPSERETSQTPSASDIAPESHVESRIGDVIDAASDGRQSTDGSCLSFGIDVESNASGIPLTAQVRSGIVLPPRKRILRNPDELVAVNMPPDDKQESDNLPLRKDFVSTTVSNDAPERSATPKSPVSSTAGAESIDSPSSSVNFRSVWKKFAAKSTPSNAGGTPGSGGVGATGGSAHRGFLSAKPLYFQKASVTAGMMGNKPFLMSGGKPRGFYHRSMAARVASRHQAKEGKEGSTGVTMSDGSTSPRVTRSQSKHKKKESPKHSPDAAAPVAPVRKSMRKKTANSKYETGEAGVGKKGKKKKVPTATLR